MLDVIFKASYSELEALASGSIPAAVKPALVAAASKMVSNAHITFECDKASPKIRTLFWRGRMIGVARYYAAYGCWRMPLKDTASRKSLQRTTWDALLDAVYDHYV